MHNHYQLHRTPNYYHRPYRRRYRPASYSNAWGWQVLFVRIYYRDLVTICGTIVALRFMGY